ncbi:hypothetical protein [Massilia genomosp. 1]|nr:hypothetical protein [Massilia genomosp. 1]
MRQHHAHIAAHGDQANRVTTWAAGQELNLLTGKYPAANLTTFAAE